MNKTFDRYASVVFAAIGAFFVVSSRSIAESAYGSQVGPNLFPLILGIILILLSVRLMFETRSCQEQGKEETPSNLKRFLIMVFATLLYAFFLEDLGYIISTSLFLFVGFQVMGNKTWWKSALVAILFTGAVYGMYVEILDGSLPGWPTWLGL